MTLPGQTITRTDGGLGLSGDTENVPLYVGPTSGTANTITRYSSSSRLKAAHGNGITAQLASWKLDHEGGSVDVLCTAATVAAANSAVTQVGSGPAVTLSGTALLPTTATIEITRGGALGVGGWAYTLDGETWVENITLPAGGTYLIPSTGVTATFAAGTHVLGTAHAFTTTPAQYNLSDLQTAWAAALAADTEWPFVTFCGYSATATAAATIAAGIVTLMSQLEATFRYSGSIVSCGNDTEANVLAQFATVLSVGLLRIHGAIQYYVGTKVPGWQWPLLPYVGEAARLCAKVSPATNPAWEGLDDDVKVTFIKNPSFDEFKEGETLHDAKINTMRTYPKTRGTFLTNALMASGPGSDYRYWQWYRVINIFSSTVEQGQQSFVNRAVRTVTSGTAEQIGCIDPRDAAGLEKGVKASLDVALTKKTSEGLPTYCSGWSYAINLTNRILTTRELQSSGKVGPLANIEQVTTEIGFSQEI
jgi:hypothetical protein